MTKHETREYDKGKQVDATYKTFVRVDPITGNTTRDFLRIRDRKCPTIRTDQSSQAAAIQLRTQQGEESDEGSSPFCVSPLVPASMRPPHLSTSPQGATRLLCCTNEVVV